MDVAMARRTERMRSLTLQILGQKDSDSPDNQDYLYDITHIIPSKRHLLAAQSMHSPKPAKETLHVKLFLWSTSRHATGEYFESTNSGEYEMSTCCR